LLEAIEMGTDAASGWVLSEIEENKEIPKPSSIENIKTEDPNSFVNIIVIDMDSYSQKYSKKSVRKNLTIPQWVNTLAEKHDANFSQLLQEAIVEKYVVAN